MRAATTGGYVLSFDKHASGRSRMLLFHGSNVVVSSPKILVPSRALDFGPGFYVTSSEWQAIRWAGLTARRRGRGAPTVSVFEFDEESAEGLSVLSFLEPTAAWLRFVSENRRGTYVGQAFDIVTGPVANDRTMAVISDYMSGNIDEETAVVLLRPQRLDDQFAFLTHRAIRTLRFLEVETVEH